MQTLHTHLVTVLWIESDHTLLESMHPGYVSREAGEPGCFCVDLLPFFVLRPWQVWYALEKKRCTMEGPVSWTPSGLQTYAVPEFPWVPASSNPATGAVNAVYRELIDT